MPSYETGSAGYHDAGQILVTHRVFMDVEDLVEVEPIGELTLKGFLKPVPAFNVTGLKPADTLG